ncbi:MAG: YfhO family protein [Clostridia bacterium]|nr:YfhO family protein [Clostridia bacterium]
MCARSIDKENIKTTRVVSEGVGESNGAGESVDNDNAFLSAADDNDFVLTNPIEKEGEDALDAPNETGDENADSTENNSDGTEGAFGTLRRGKSFNRLKAFLDDNWLYFAAPILICSLFMGVLYAYKVYPFSKTSMSNYDLLAQICPFLEHFYDVIDGKSSLFYSTAIIGGADVFGTLAYCAVSPFTFLFFVCGKGNVYYAISFVLPIKLSCVALSAIFFMKKLFKNIPDYVMLTFSVLYAYCGYMFVANTYINWVDFLIYMPFVILGFKKLVNEGRIRYFAVAYSLMIYTCFSISCFALLMIYVLLMAYAVILRDGRERSELITKMCISLVIAVALSLPIMVPALRAYIRSGRNTGLFEKLDKDLSADHLYAKTSYILSDSLFLMLTVLYFVKSRFKNKIDWFYLAVGVVIMLPVFIDEVCNLLNFGSYMSYALRFGFLNAAYALYMACLTVDGLKKKKLRKKSISVLTALGFLLLGTVAVAFIVIYNNKVIDEGLYKFSSKFAHSLGGLEVIAPIFGVVGVLVIIAAVLYATRLTDIKALTFVLIVVCAVQAAFYNIHVVKGNTFNPVRYEQYEKIFTSGDYADVFAAADEEHGLTYTEYYRIKDYDAAITNDAPFTTHTSSFSVFSSVIDKDNLAATKFFKYGGNGINSIESKGGLFFGDALLGYKYYFLHNDKKSHASENRSYNVTLTDTQQSYFAAGLNTLVFPNAYYVKSGDLVFDGDYYQNMNKLYRFLGGGGELFDEYEIPEAKVLYDEDTEVYTVRINTVDEGQWYMFHDFPAEYEIKYSTSSGDPDNMKKLEKDTLINFNYHKKNSGSYFYCYLKSTGDKKIDKDVIRQYCKGRCLPLMKISSVQKLLNTRAATYTITGGDTFNVKVTADGDDCYLFMNYVAIDGFKATVNGKNAELIDNVLNFMLVKIDKGENDVKIEYHSPYIKLILVGTALGALIVALTYFVVKKQKFIYGIMLKVVPIAAAVLTLAVVGFFFIFPSVMFFIKLGKLLIGLVF